MHKRKHVVSISRAFLPALLLFLLCVSFLFPALASPDAYGYDYVDNNTSNVDGAAGIGAHSSFMAQQDGPDSIYDILTEADTSVSDNNNIDSEIVTHGSTTGISDAQTADGITENMTEGTPTSESYSEASSSSDVSSLSVPMPSGTIEGDLLVAVFSKDSSSGTLSSPSGWTDLCELSTGGSRFLVAYKMAGAGESGPYTFLSTDSDQMTCGIARFSGVDTNNPIDAQSSTQIANTNAPQCLSATTTVDNALVLRVMGADDDDYSSPGNYPSGHSGVFTVQSTGSWGETHCAMAYVEQPSAGSTGVSSFSMTTNEQWGTITIAIAPSVDYQLDVEHVVNSIANYKNYSLTTRAGGSSESFYLQMYDFTSSQWVTMSTITGSILTWYNTSFIKADFVNSTNQARIRYWQGVDATQETLHVDYSGVYGWNATNYELDLEVQWTNATYTQTYEELCIYGGTMGSENVQVDVWTGSSWQNLITDLSSGWNNISITDYLTSLTFTIRFKGDTETGDISQDSWEIDCTLLHTWEVPPTANFFYTPEQPYTGESITFNASASYDPDGSIVSYFWDFGDGTNGTDEVTTHIYDDNGTYTVALTVTDNDGLSDTCLSDVTVLNRPPAASFTESEETVYTGDTVNFNASDSYDPDGTIVSYFWDFGDGANSTGVVVHHAYSDDGIYTATLTVTDNDGATDSTSSTKTVLNRAPTASFTESAETVYTGETITFNASNSYDLDGDIVSYFWDFGDGTNGTGVTVEHAYAEDGNYIVTLTLTDDDGATDIATSTKTVLNRPPVASFTESAEAVYTSEVISFNASDSYDPDGTIVSYFWDFGDGTNASGIIIDHSYADDGNYIVTLTATDDDGATNTTTSTKTVLNKPPVASFTETAETVHTGDFITFNASSSYDPDGTIVSYFWDFGDGTNTTGVIVEHSYVDGGVYTVTLTVTDDDGATDTTTSTKTVLNKPPVASFSESAETVYVGEFITFNASGSYDPDGIIVSYFWDFGDGTNRTGVIVDHAYDVNETFTVTLTVTDDDGSSDSASSTKTILMNEPPVALFTESAETVYTGDAITFNASDSYDPDGSVVEYFWDFGDGTNGTGVVVEHSYIDDDLYAVTLTVTDDRDATSSTSSSKTVLNRPPVASFSESATTVLTGEAIYFDASTGYDPDGVIVSYFWDFGDGTNASGIIIDHSYADDGNYIVTLTATDDDGATDSTTATKTVLNRPPVASFTESAETVYTGEAISFNGSDSYDPDGTIVSYFWSFGDGTNTTGVTVEHAYAGDGNYTITLTITDDDGASSSTSSIKIVLNRSPVASFTETTDTVYTGETITFNASSSYDPDGTIVTYFWDFGDGTNATGIIAEHAYVDDGNYMVTLTVVDDDGAAASTTATKAILNKAPTAIFTESVETVYTGESIYFNANDSYDPDGVVVSYSWDFGDGTNATGVVVDHAYADDGDYTVTLTVTDDDGATDTTTSTKTVLNRPPVASFTESAETVYTGETITFNASSSFDPDGAIVGYFWDFGEGTNVTGVIVQHSYADNGTYTVTLTVTDGDGETDIATSAKTVLNTPPVVIFTESAETVYTSETITFNASDSYDPDGTIVNYFWSFGDGTNATGLVVSHAYASDGVYTVALVVTDDDGATASANATKTVLNRPPVALFTESAETVLTDEAITFNASDSYDPDGYPVDYFWDFGDGTNATGMILTHYYIDDGTYMVTLTVTDDDGSSASTSSTKTVLNRPPAASFTESVDIVYTGEAIMFNASNSYDPDGNIISYFWDFGEGTNATGVTTEHAYSDDGDYTVTLTVTDDDGATDTTTSTKTVLNRPPVASFTESAETVYTGELITFNASASYDLDGYVAIYSWNFGDGTNTTGAVVEQSYPSDGNYTVILTVTDDDGATDTTTSTKTVLNRPPVSSFTESAETVYTGEVITFNASDSYDPDGNIISYFWDLGDGTNATGMAVEHAYDENGNYTVALTVTDNEGETASTSAVKTILNRPPVAIFTESAETVLTGEVVTFDPSSSYDPDGTIVNFFWDFGDGTNATGITIGHAYANGGNYTVALTVTDDDGATAMATAVKTILNRPPVAIFTTSATTVLTGEVVTFDPSSSYDSDGIIVNFFWEFGDGMNATGVIVEHAYADDATYVVILTVTDDDGATGVATATIQVLNRPPVAIFTESATIIYTSETITFSASDSYDPDGTIVNFFWDFGDGANATDMIVTHAYSENGSYTVTLTITDDDGATGTTTAIKTVLNKPPIPIFTESVETMLIDEIIYFNASDSYDADGTIISYFWDFGDGNNATGVTTEHAYSSSGVYTVTLTVMDNDGATGTATAIKTVEITPPVAIFTESAETVLTNVTIYFNASDSYDPDGVIVSYFWDFGDGANATGVTADHTYPDDGTYTVTLTVTDDDSAADTSTSTKTVLNRSPAALFTESAETILTGETIYLNASGSYDPDGTIVNYFWDFGDSTNATGIIAEQAYADDGVYTVTLTVTDDDGASSSTSAVKTVLNRSPVAVFTESTETVYTSEVIVFNASDSYDPDGVIASYFWDFGDGTNATGVVVDHSYLDDGVCTITLTVTDDDGAPALTSATKTVLNRSPVATFTESATTVLTGDLINFNASACYDPDGVIVSYFWDFGDGTNGTGASVDYAYSDDGIYTVTLTVTDDDGAASTATSTKTILNRSPVATFTESATTVSTGTCIYFNASGSYDPDGVIVSYLWDFGDGTNATGVAAEHAYTAEGTYTVTLTVTDDDGALASTTATKIVGNSPPVAIFTESAETVYTGIVISLDASGSYDPDGTIVSYFWDFGDGTNATSMIVGHAYTDDGTFTVSLTVTDDNGATSTTTAIKSILNRYPIPIFTISTTMVYTNKPVYFNASDSYDLDGVIVSYFWDFGDGTNATEVVVNHAYTDDGSYLVTLTVTDDDNATATATTTINVLNRTPAASFIESAETAYTDETITFDGSGSYDPDGVIVSYLWDFGDGTNATEVIVEHAYSEDGSYTITLTVTDDDGATASMSSTKTILNRSPVALFTESAGSVLSGEVIYFNASGSYDLDGVIVSYLWDFGDGTNATGATTEHSYADNGTYTVVLTVTDDDGASASTSATKIVGNKPPVAFFTESAETVYTGEVIYFSASGSYDPDGVIVSYFWDFGDGMNTTGITADHAYADDGNYSVTLTVTDDDGATASMSSTKTILNRSPVALFTESAETVYIGQPITFNGSDSYDPDGVIVSYFWNFGDGTNATGTVVEHAYSINGTHIVTLTISDDDDASDATLAIKTILWNEPPVASFTESAETAHTGETVYFNASESYDLDGSIVSYFWDFGDGTNTTGVTAEHAYADDGNYTVVLTVTDDRGATNTAAAIKTVINRSPVASFTESGEVVYTGEIIDFNATVSYDPDGFIVFYFWDFGDGTNATDIAVSHFYTDNGTYIVTLTIIDDDDAHNSTTATKTVLNRPPVTIFSESAETIHTGQPITFNASDSYDPDGVIVSYFWNFGDGTNATGLVVEHAYSLDGSFTVTLNVTDDDGGFGVATSVKTILWNEPPVASFTESAETAYKGEIISFNASNSYDYDGNIVSYLWDFDDGTNATSMVVEHVYVSCGNYTVTLIVTDDKDATGVATAVKTILSRSPIASFTESAETAHTGEIIRFNASDSYDPDGVIVSYLWDFGDGTNVTGMIVDHAYTDDGIYTVTLVVMDDDNVSSSAGTVKTILNRAPSASFTLSPETAYTFELITFNASDSYDTDGSIVNYFWNLGDGRTVDGEYAVIVRSYDSDESYTVTLTITDNDGATNTTTSTITVLNRPPVASFTVSAETSYAGEPITFDASDSYDLDGYIINYMWNFGDGASAGGLVVSHAYSTNGTFIATLSIMDDNKASNSTTVTMTILWNELPVASFTESAETVYTSESIVFDASSSYDPDGVIVSYLWDFGDGTNATGFTTSYMYVEDGNYTVSLTIKDDKGATNSISAVKTVLNRPPAISFTESVETAYVNEPILFNASSCYDPDGVIVSYFWDFGDGTNATDVVVSHAYSTNGTFIVTLTVEDDDAAVNSAQTTKTILASTGIHDVAVIEVTPSATEVYKRQILNVTVVVKNEGTETENFNVTLHRAAIQGWHLVDADGHLVWFCHGESSCNFLLMTSITIPADNPVLTFDTKYDLEFLWDFGFVQISRDAGTTWQSLENAYTTYNHDPGTDPNIIANLPGFTGNSQDWPAWITMTFNLTDYAGETVMLGFRYITDTAHLEEGWYIDNVSVNDNAIPNQAFEQSNPPPVNAIQIQTVTNLAPGYQATLTFSWNTTTTPKGTYSIGATASAIIGETETSNNTYLNGAVKVKACPDLDGDGDVDIYDVVIVTSIYGCKEGDARWNPKADLSEDGVIDIYDVVGVTSHYGETNIYET